MDAGIVFKALGDDTRQRTLRVLARHGLSVSELVEVLQRPQSTVSRHLKVLRQAGLIRDRRQANTVTYSVLSPPDGAGDRGIAGRMLEWIAEQEMEEDIAGRLQAVINRRSDSSNRYFAELGESWDTIRELAFGKRFHLEAFIALLPAEWTVADVGTGTGYMLPVLAQHFQWVIGVDPVEAMLAVAEARLGKAGCKEIELRKGDLSRLPIECAEVDLALSVLVLHHTPAPQEAVAELHRIVRKGGRVLVVEQCAHENQEFREEMQDSWWGFAPAELAEMVRDAGFERVAHKTLATVERPKGVPELFVVTGTGS